MTPHHYLNYILTLNYRKGKTTHNSLDFRGKEFELVKPRGSFRIVTLGGSSIYTISVIDDEKTFPVQFERTIASDFCYENVEVINARVGGYNFWEPLIHFEFRVLDLSPDLIIVYHGPNDIYARLVEPDVYKGDNSGRRKQWALPEMPKLEKSLVVRVVTRRLGLSGRKGFSGHTTLAQIVNSLSSLGVGHKDRWYTVHERIPEPLTQNWSLYFERNLTNMVAIAKANNVAILGNRQSDLGARCADLTNCCV